MRFENKPIMIYEWPRNLTSYLTVHSVRNEKDTLLKALSWMNSTNHQWTLMGLASCVSPVYWGSSISVIT